MSVTKVLVAGVSTRAMAESAARAGFDVTNMSGGYNAWSVAGLPVTSVSPAGH